ncbi:MAG: acyl-CoA dehydrogenase, partial [Cyanobacteria bacterium P01_F01_bin.4]
LAIARIVARRDLTVAIAHGVTYLGSAAVWVGGSKEQKHRLAQSIKNNQQVSFGLTEKNHGSDILANQTSVDRAEVVNTEVEYSLSGEKWLIGNASRSSTMTVFARTRPQAGPRGFSLFMVEKSKLPDDSYTHLPKIKTHGLRGADISGICFHQSPLSKNALVGSPGKGLDLTLKAFQITKTLHAGAAPSLGQADTALRVTINFVLSRRLYGGTVWDIPHAHQELVASFLDILICDCVSIAAVRALHVVPDQMSLISAIIKYFVPKTVEGLIQRLSAVLGARHYLREGHCWGIFQKIMRDHAIISIFDGSAAVNLHGIGAQLSSLIGYRAQTAGRNHPETKANLETIFDVEQPLPDFDPRQLALLNRGRDDILQGLEIALNKIKSFQADTLFKPDVIRQLLALVEDMTDAIDRLEKTFEALKAQVPQPFNKSPELFELSGQYCSLHAASACILLWVHYDHSKADFLSQGEWLVLCLTRLMNGFYPQKYSASQNYYDKVAHHLLELYKQDMLFSVFPFQLAKTHAV